MTAFKSYLKRMWCDLTHGGGTILRDPLGRLNWRCCKCARWANPVPREAEMLVINAHIRDDQR